MNHRSWDNLHRETQISMETTKNCGCYQRGEEWHLCGYHRGMEDGIDLILDTLEQEQEGIVPGSVAVMPRLTDLTGGGA